MPKFVLKNPFKVTYKSFKMFTRSAIRINISPLSYKYAIFL